MNKTLLAFLLVVLPLVLAVHVESRVHLSVAHSLDTQDPAAAPTATVAEPVKELDPQNKPNNSQNSPVVNENNGALLNGTLGGINGNNTVNALNGTSALNGTQNASDNKKNGTKEFPKRKRASSLVKLAKLIAEKVVPAPAKTRPPRDAKLVSKAPAPQYLPTVGEAEITFHLKAPNSVLGEDRQVFEQRLLVELSKGVEQPARRFDVLNVTSGYLAGSTAGPSIHFRVKRISPKDDPRSKSAQQIANDFYERAMNPENLWANLPLLSHIDRTNAIVIKMQEWKPRPKEPSLHGQVKVDVDIRKIEPQIGAYLKAVEVDIAAGIECEPEQIEVTGAIPDDGGKSLSTLIITFDIHSRLRELPEAELTPTRIVNDIKKQLLDPKSHLRQRPTLRRADAFFPVQNIQPKEMSKPEWVLDQEQYQVAEIQADPVKYERPHVLPTLYVAAPPASTAFPMAGANQVVVAAVTAAAASSK